MAPRRRGRVGRLVVQLVAACALLGVLYYVWNSQQTVIIDTVHLAALGTLQGKVVCKDTCPGRTNNGVCDEGRPTPGAAVNQSGIYEVFCDLGTDCSDCGTWVHTNTKESANWQPIAEIREHNFEVFVRQTAFPRPFWLAYTDPKKDIDVSLNVNNTGMFEAGFSGVWHRILSERCIIPNDFTRRLVVDVGANFGYYTLLSATMGCRVVAWEPVPYFAAFLKYGLLLNNLTDLVQLREAIVGSVTGSELTMVVPQRGIWGTAGVGGLNINKAIDNEGEYDRITKTVERVDDFVREDALIMKVDVEGFEPTALRSAKTLLLNYTVDHIFMEYSPGVAEKNQDWELLEDNPVMLMGLARAGYKMMHMEYAFRDTWPDWTGKAKLPVMQLVTQAVLVHDIADARLLQLGTLGCPLPPAVTKMKVPLWVCNQIPEAYDPQSFRSTFGYNTNIWAYKNPPTWAVAKGEAVLIPLEKNTKNNFFTGGGLGMLRRVCADLAPEAQVAHRCPCTKKPICGGLEWVVKSQSNRGSMPPFPLPDKQVDPTEMDMERW